ncbi:MAG: organic hydroperoxide resistance protein [Rhizobacter sp.]|nr:organic hydroperoxide resistance protein [Ferruginibacter sp.]
MKNKDSVHTLSEIEKGKVIYTASVNTSGGRGEGISRSSDEKLNIRLSSPGSGGDGTNPEQLFAAGWSACFESAMATAAYKMKIRLPRDLSINAEVDLCLEEGEYTLQVRLNISLPGIERAVAEAIADAAHQICPYSKATRRNIDVQVNVV